MPDPRPPIAIVRSDRIAEFYRDRAAKLHATVRLAVRTSDDTVIEDACQQAWMQLIRHPEVTLDARGAAWMATVAIRAGWRLAQPQRDIPASSIRGERSPRRSDRGEPSAETFDPEARTLDAEHYAELACQLAALTGLERRDLLLQAAGFSYIEIAEMTRGSVNAVNHRLSRGRAKLRK
jgi:DNA-directed RNA polymerase specialized sigma24 family protein